jgi:cytochrome c biogenesis protein CcdA
MEVDALMGKKSEAEKRRKRLFVLAPVVLGYAFLLVFGLRLAIGWFDALGVPVGWSIVVGGVSVILLWLVTMSLYTRLVLDRRPDL